MKTNIKYSLVLAISAIIITTIITSFKYLPSNQNNLHEATVLGSVNIGNKEITSVVDVVTGCMHKSNLHTKNLFIAGENVSIDMTNNEIIKPNLPERVFVDKCNTQKQFDLELESFKEDSLTLKLREVGVNMLSENDKTELTILIKEAKTITSFLYDKYGTNKVHIFVNILRKNQSKGVPGNQRGDGNKCKRNSDGTVNSDSCSGFWDGLVVGIRSLFCPDSPSDAAFDCVQAAVCATC